MVENGSHLQFGCATIRHLQRLACRSIQPSFCADKPRQRRVSPSEAREPPGRLQAQLFSPPHALSQLVTGGRDQEF
jgi:hypothetical protein